MRAIPRIAAPALAAWLVASIACAGYYGGVALIGAFTAGHGVTITAGGQLQDAGAAPSTLTSVTCGTGLSGGTITTTGTCATSLTTVAASLGADVLLNNTSNYFDGPSVAQGTSGTWLASGTVSLIDTTQAGGAPFYCKLWDGTTIFASGYTATPATAYPVSMALSGVIASPAANIRISCRDTVATTGKILFNQTGSSKDSTLTVVRLQ